MELIQPILQIIALMGISIFLSVLAMQTIKLTGADLKDMKQRNRSDVLILAAVFNLLFIGAVALILKLWSHQPMSRLGFSFALKDFVFLVFAFLFSIGLALLYILYLNRKDKIKITWVKNYFSHTSGLLNLILAFIVLFIAALQEEVLFRGYFAFTLLPFGFIYALFISAIVFTFWHYLTNKISFFQTLDWFLGGIMLFLIYWLSGSVWVAAVVHFIRNVINVVIFNISSENSIITYETPFPSRYKTIYTLSCSLFLILSGFCFYHFVV